MSHLTSEFPLQGGISEYRNGRTGLQQVRGLMVSSPGEATPVPSSASELWRLCARSTCRHFFIQEEGTKGQNALEPGFSRGSLVNRTGASGPLNCKATRTSHWAQEPVCIPGRLPPQGLMPLTGHRPSLGDRGMIPVRPWFALCSKSSHLLENAGGNRWLFGAPGTFGKGDQIKFSVN